MIYTVRQYTNDNSFEKLTFIPPWVGEIQVALAFARDYNGDNSTNGKFIPYWETDKVTASVITQFKKADRHFQVKVLVSIGDRSAQYPFRFEAGEKDSWVSNATESLTSIIKEYNLDGIDVYYEHIESGQRDFVDCIGQLMTNLKEKGAISVASISPTAPLNTNFYFPLYQKYNNYIDTVVYQCFTEPDPINSNKMLEDILNNIANKFYPKNKLLAGYSTTSEDWDTVSLYNYGSAVFSLLRTRTLAGTAIWDTGDWVTAFDGLKWILDMVSPFLKGGKLFQVFLPK